MPGLSFRSRQPGWGLITHAISRIRSSLLPVIGCTLQGNPQRRTFLCRRWLSAALQHLLQEKALMLRQQTPSRQSSPCLHSPYQLTPLERKQLRLTHTATSARMVLLSGAQGELALEVQPALSQTMLLLLLPLLSTVMRPLQLVSRLSRTCMRHQAITMQRQRTGYKMVQRAVRKCQ